MKKIKSERDKFWDLLREKQNDPRFMKAVRKFIKLTTS